VIRARELATGPASALDWNLRRSIPPKGATMPTITLALLCLLATHAGAELDPATRFADDFWRHWGDGQAELASYDLTFARYGAERSGTAIAIFVTETFSHSLRVKADPGNHPDTDTYPVMKLNLVEDFPTGVYDYNLMTSTFVSLVERDDQPRGHVTKVSHSMQEWCGHAWIQWTAHPEHLDWTMHSYFDGEADQDSQLDLPEGGFAEDAVLLWARELAGPFLDPGASTSRPLFTASRQVRMEHRDPTWTNARFHRAAETTTITVPAGDFEVEERWITQDDREIWRIWTEAAAPHRIVKWANAHGQTAELVASDRMPYWRLNGPDGIERLGTIGLQPRPARTP